MDDILGTKINFRSLSLKDLLEARDLYHYHLMNKANVVGTAIGLYLIRKTEPYPDRDPSKNREQPAPKGERTFENSEVRQYSWPCVLAMVRDWVDKDRFGGDRGQLQPDQMVPKTLYMPDGRMVPVCVVKVEQGEPDLQQLPNWHWPDSLYGGGMPILVETQGQVHQATAGCLVSDGHTIYALTSRHVCGALGEPVFTLAKGERVPIGAASRLHLTRLPFTEVYPEFRGQRTFINLDVGLIELSDLNDWTSQIFGLGPTGALANLNELNITTRLIDAPVVAAGAASGRLEGRIKALFYRYKSVGGYDYVSDFLIAPRQLDQDATAKPAQTQPGDSGAVWHLVTNQKKSREDTGWVEDDDFEGDLRPLALEWGGQVFVEKVKASSFAFALATSLTTICQQLNVELVLEHNSGVLPYWGQTGHYSIASFACNALPAGKLKTFMRANVDHISFTIGDLTPKEIAKRIKEAKANDELVPLADVPDLIWKNHKTKVVGGHDDRFTGPGRSTGPEHPTHYADVDEERPSDHKSLLNLSLASEANLSVDFWQEFYNETGNHEQSDRGLLPFRVWQFFVEMMKFAQQKQPDKFLCAAGLLAHYVGDACQPLHGSVLADGFENGTGKGVHSTYETKMIDRKAGGSSGIVQGIKKELGEPHDPLPAITSGKEAALAIIALMDRSAKRIPPTALINAYVAAGGTNKVAVQDALWQKFGKDTIKVMTDGARVLARIWEGAWAAGHGNAIAENHLGTVDGDLLRSHYIDEKFVESLDLDHIAPALL